jgi:hypothetical protein
VVHEHGEQKNDRQRNADQPEQRTFSERHCSLPILTFDSVATPTGSIGSMAFDGQKNDGGSLLSAEARLRAKADATKQSMLCLRGEMDCFAEPVIRRALARPVGSQ